MTACKTTALLVLCHATVYNEQCFHCCKVLEYATCKHRILTSRPSPHPWEGCCRIHGTLSIAL